MSNGEAEATDKVQLERSELPEELLEGGDLPEGYTPSLFGAPADKCIRGPDVACLGFIPYFKDITKMPRNAYSQHTRHSYPAFSLLFDSGNSAPPAAFPGVAGFLDYIGDKDFRGATALFDVRLFCDASGNAVGVLVGTAEEVGYTPMNAQLNWDLADHPKFTLHYSKGAGSGGLQVATAGGCATITHWLRFKIGGIGNLGNWILTGHWAPFVWLRVDYEICCDGAVKVDFTGSFIPTQHYYVSWLRDGLHDMLGNSAAQIDNFLGAGDCKDAPGKLSHTWRGAGQPC